MARPPKDYKPEFRQLGLDSVRKELLMRRWDADKLAAARLWVERQDTDHWLADRKDEPPRVKTKRFRKYALYIAIAFGLAFAATRLFRTLL